VQAMLRILRTLPGRIDDLLVSAARAIGGKLLSTCGALTLGVGPVWRRSRRLVRRLLARIMAILLRGEQMARRHVSASVAVGLLALLVTAVTAALWRKGASGLLAALCGLTRAQVGPLMVARADVAVFLLMLLRLAALVAFLAGGASLLVFIRKPFAFWVAKAAAAGYALFALLLLYTIWRVPAYLYEIDPELFNKYSRNEMWVTGTGRVLPLLMLAVFFLFVLILRVVSDAFSRRPSTGPGLGDRIWKDLVTHGPDPAYRKALYRAAFIHVFVFLILPHMLGWQGCMKPYGVPLGSGSPVLEMVRIRKIKKKIEKKYVFNLESAISFYVPKIDDSEVFEEVEELTERLHEAESIGKLGQGGGKEGGWPNGMEKAKVRFIRLEYSGGDWDQDMGFGSDYNMLLKFRELTGFNIWPNTEHIMVAQLRRFHRKRAPPFVYITGGLEGGMFFTQSEIKTLRYYCLEMGGLIFADNGGGNFDGNFRLLMRRVFPDLPMITISHDDVIFAQPFVFPNGAPPLWHHSGDDAIGIKSRGRWVVFYHQGDINDAWKDDHSGASKGLANQAFKLGINVINYAFNQYMQINFSGEVQR